MSDDLDGVVRYGYEVGHLSRSPRAGWQLAGIANPESVAEHSQRVGVLAYLIASLEGCNAERAAVLGLFHDVPETRTTDLDAVAEGHVARQDAVDVARVQTEGMPPHLAERIVGIIDEVEAKASRESVCSKDADKLDCLLRAREYQEQQGARLVGPWVDNMLAGMRTASGRDLASRAVDASPGEWFREIASAYGLPS